MYNIILNVYYREITDVSFGNKSILAFLTNGSPSGVSSFSILFKNDSILCKLSSCHFKCRRKSYSLENILSQLFLGQLIFFPLFRISLETLFEPSKEAVNDFIDL